MCLTVQAITNTGQNIVILSYVHATSQNYNLIHNM